MLTRYYIMRDASCVVVQEKTGLLPLSITGGWGGRVDPVISKPARGHTLLDVVVADPTRVDLVTRAAVVPQHATLEAARQKERHCCGRPRGHSFLSPSRGTVRCCLKYVNFCAIALSEHFLSMADHHPRLASSSLGWRVALTL